MRSNKHNNPMYPFYVSTKVNLHGKASTYWRCGCSSCRGNGWWLQPDDIPITRELIIAGFRIRNWSMDTSGKGVCGQCRGLPTPQTYKLQKDPDYKHKLLAIRDGVIAEGAQPAKPRPLPAAPTYTPPPAIMHREPPPNDTPTPSREQRRDISNVLNWVYDLNAQKYPGTWTDAAVAREVGEGILPEWVADERERAYGPAGDVNNPESLAELQRLMQACTEAGAAAMEAAVTAETAVAALKKKLELEG